MTSELVRGALELANSEQSSEAFQMYAFLVTVEGMEPCKARALAYGRKEAR